MDKATQARLGEVLDFLDWLLTQPHGDFKVGLQKGAREDEMRRWAPNHKALAYAYLGYDLTTGKPLVRE